MTFAGFPPPHPAFWIILPFLFWVCMHVRPNFWKYYEVVCFSAVEENPIHSLRTSWDWNTMVQVAVCSDVARESASILKTIRQHCRWTYAVNVKTLKGLAAISGYTSSCAHTANLWRRDYGYVIWTCKEKNRVQPKKETRRQLFLYLQNVLQILVLHDDLFVQQQYAEILQ